MATRDAILQRQIVALDRIKAALPGVAFRDVRHQGGPDAQRAVDLEVIADALEQRGGTGTESKGN